MTNVRNLPQIFHINLILGSKVNGRQPGKEQMKTLPQHIQYSERYTDDEYEYRHVILPHDLAKLCPRGRLLSEEEWRALGLQMSKSYCFPWSVI